MGYQGGLSFSRILSSSLLQVAFSSMEYYIVYSLKIVHFNVLMRGLDGNQTKSFLPGKTTFSGND